MKYVIGMDIGIGSIGWSVIRSDADCKRIEDFGVRIFEPGENASDRKSNSQIRREYRSVRRVLRRRKHRKELLKAHLENIGLTTIDRINEYFKHADGDIISLRVKGLDKKLAPEEIAACLINIANRRGYRPFYENEELSQYEKTSLNKTRQFMLSGEYRTSAEMILKNEQFDSEESEYRSYRNRSGNEETVLIERKWLRDEVEKILKKQSEFYPCLNDRNTNAIKRIIFDQRDFEDGPGDKNDPFRRYTGFLESMGQCRFYPDEKRGYRATLTADTYSLVNELSQYSYVDENGCFVFDSALAHDLIASALKNAKFTKSDFNKICKAHGIVPIYGGKGKDTDISRCFKFLKAIKPILEADGFDWETVCNIDTASDPDSILNRIGIIVSENITPARRKKALKNLNILNDDSITALCNYKFGGTSSVSYKYMSGAIEAFLNGDIYGKHQASHIEETATESVKHTKLPVFDKDFEFFKNPVVFRAINESRKVINAITEKYGSPSAINIEVGSEVSRSFANRTADKNEQTKRMKEKDAAKKAIAELLGVDIASVTSKMIDRYFLGELQGWKCMYSGKEINKEECLRGSKTYEIDHIVPFSLILDNTLNNKALVLTSENQLKKQQTPLMYLSGERRKNFIGTVNELFRAKKIKKKKYAYLLQPDLNDEKMSEWKSRNLNDMRYISRFMVGYLKENLKFDNSSKSEGRWQNVYAVKGSLTSMFRKLWLNETTWGRADKASIKAETYLDHAVDAVVIGNCLPVYVEIAQVNLRLRDIYKSNGRQFVAEYWDCFNKGVEMISRYYNIDKDTVRAFLKKSDRIPSLIPDLREEVDRRFVDHAIYSKYQKEVADHEGKDFKKPTYEEAEQAYRVSMENLYPTDLQFAHGLSMPLISCKPERKYRGKITADNPVKLREIDSKLYTLSKKEIGKIERKDIEKIYTSDTQLIAYLIELFDGAKDTATLGDIMKEKGISEIRTKNGNAIRKLTLRNICNKDFLKKEIDENNHTYLDTAKYYCVELYKDIKDKLRVQGIKRADIIPQNGKLCLAPWYKQPDGFFKHVMYLQKNDYLKVYENGKLLFCGYYLSVEDIRNSKLYFIIDNQPGQNRKENCKSIHIKSEVKKYTVDILGKIGKKEIKCGEPLSSAKVKK